MRCKSFSALTNRAARLNPKLPLTSEPEITTFFGQLVENLCHVNFRVVVEQTMISYTTKLISFCIIVGHHLRSDYNILVCHSSHRVSLSNYSGRNSSTSLYVGYKLERRDKRKARSGAIIVFTYGSDHSVILLVNAR